MVKPVAELYFVDICDKIIPEIIDPKANQRKHFKDLHEGAIIYLSLNYAEFFRDFMVLINKKFVLISGLSDYTAPYLKYDEFKDVGNDILNNPCLISWYAINITHPHPKLKHIPIGIPRSIPMVYDEHCNYMGWFNTEWIIGHKTTDKVVEEYRSLGFNYCNILERIKSPSKNNLLYINFTVDNSNNCNIPQNEGFRKKMDEYIRNSWLDKYYTKKRENWIHYILTLQSSKFTIEFFGKCLDGYRVWEALYAGTIPIVFRSSINELHEDLPIVIIDSIEELTEDFLNKKYDEIISRTDYKFEKLTVDYWVDIIRADINKHCLQTDKVD